MQKTDFCSRALTNWIKTATRHTAAGSNQSNQLKWTKESVLVNWLQKDKLNYWVVLLKLVSFCPQQTGGNVWLNAAKIKIVLLFDIFNINFQIMHQLSTSPFASINFNFFRLRITFVPLARHYVGWLKWAQLCLLLCLMEIHLNL